MKTSHRVALAAAAVIAIVGTAAGAASAGADTTAPTAVATFTFDSSTVSVSGEECVVVEASESGELGALVEVGSAMATDIPAEMVEVINADTDALVAHLAEAGITVDVVTDDNGVRTPDLDLDDAAVREAVEAYWTEQGAGVVGMSAESGVIMSSGSVAVDQAIEVPTLTPLEGAVAPEMAVGGGGCFTLAEPA